MTLEQVPRINHPEVELFDRRTRTTENEAKISIHIIWLGSQPYLNAGGISMNVSQKKIAANRENARRSTGPKTDSGKSKSKKNAITHGVYASTTLITGEDAALYEAIKKEQRKIFKPHTFIEKALVDHLIRDLWNLRRIAKAEHRYVSAQQDAVYGQNVQAIKRRQLELVANARDPKTADDYTGEERHQILESFIKEVNSRHLETTYESVFIIDRDGYFQRLAMMKRHILQSILGIERELQRRLSKRKTKKIPLAQDSE